MAERVELEKVRECDRCGYVACICPVLRDHKPECTRRKALLNTSPTECKAHEVYACSLCFPCDCRKAAS